ncbi:protein FAR-RED IMPAIRED RESPONSE 1 isoform X2 [Andrographis paniculata]|uniref:protein FAR-RED IMPAIRED RESPONSE 1 isoform X2 n=1 Tax=Andrographis paniculata TaxID=175694 RepID=UPI0021E88444|nr:protein FAR-RED IMPAIRED RESPONSE 1 isoform X2 [Andrographis paniculata]
MVDFEGNVEGGGEGMGLNMVDVVNAIQTKDGQVNSFCKADNVEIECENIEPRGGIEFDSHEAAYSFYQDYAKSMGFTTSIKNSRRSKKTKEFIDAKFACSRYGITPESESGSSRRPSVKKTDCKASMHVKRKRDGKWYIHEFIKEHNHELLPALAYHFRIHRNVKLAEKNNIDILHAVSERTRKMYVEMSRQSGGSPNFCLSKNEFDHQFDRGRYLTLEEGDSQIMLEHFVQFQKDNPFFFYAIDLNEEQRMRNLLWVDAKSRKDYVSFCDVVFFDTSYLKINDKMPIGLFIGVNHHFQPMLLGCALLADESKPTYVWLMKTWLRAMGGQPPKTIISDQDKQLKLAIEEVFPFSRHCFALWHILERVPEYLAHVLKQHGNFMKKFNKCIFKSLTDEEFDMRWWKMVSRFELQENEWVHSLYVDYKKWVPLFMRDTFLGGLSTNLRSESVNSFFDKYFHKKVSLKEFMRQYGAMLQNKYEEEDIADFDTWHKQPALKSPSPWEKQMSTIYTHAIFRKFQVEVLGVVGCHPKKEKEIGGVVYFRVDDCAKNENFVVTWNETKLEVSCSCLMFEYKGFLCRHSMIVLQICGLTRISSRYILKRWTKDAKNKQAVPEETEKVPSRVQRYNDLCKRAIELGEEGSLCEANYNVACRALVDALRNCVNVNNRTTVECSNNSVGLRCAEEGSQSIQATKTIKKKTTSKKRKDNLSSEGIALNGYYGSQQHVHGVLNLMEPPHDAYYVSQQAMQGLGHLNSITSGHDGFYGAQQSMPGLGHIDFRQSTFTFGMQDEHNVRPTQLHGAARHARGVQQFD